MTISLSPQTARLLRQMQTKGAFVGPDDVVKAGLLALKQQATLGDFAPGELEALIEEGERSIREEGTIDGRRARELSRRRRARQRAVRG